MMKRIWESQILPLALAVAIGLGIGWWAHGGARAQAAGPTAPAQFQFSSGDGLLSVYYPGERTLYVYPAMSGSEHIYCTYKFKIGSEGDAIDRQNCPIGKLF